MTQNLVTIAEDKHPKAHIIKSIDFSTNKTVTACGLKLTKSIWSLPQMDLVNFETQPFNYDSDCKRCRKSLESGTFGFLIVSCVN